MALTTSQVKSALVGRYSGKGGLINQPKRCFISDCNEYSVQGKSKKTPSERATINYVLKSVCHLLPTHCSQVLRAPLALSPNLILS